MKIGVVLPYAGPVTTPENIVTVAQWAEALGYHSVWHTDHVTLPEQVDAYYPYRKNGRWDYPPETKWLDPLLALAWAGATAPNVKLGTSVQVIPLRNPVLLAKQISTLDFLTGGRVIVGVGVGWMEEEFKLIGKSFPDRGSRAIEMINLMRQFWTGETVNFQGKFYQVSGCKMHPQSVQRSIPVVWGGHSDATLKRVAMVGDGWHPTQISLEQLENGIKKLRQYCEEYNRDPDSVVIIARPGDNYRIDAESHARHLELGIDHVIVDSPIKITEDPELKTMQEQMGRVAKVCGLVPQDTNH